MKKRIPLYRRFKSDVPSRRKGFESCGALSIEDIGQILVNDGNARRIQLMEYEGHKPGANEALESAIANLEKAIGRLRKQCGGSAENFERLLQLCIKRESESRKVHQ